MATDPIGPATASPTPTRDVEAALARLGFARIPPVAPALPAPEFWVREAGVPRRAFPVYVERGGGSVADGYLRSIAARERSPRTPTRAILVVPSDRSAAEAWVRVVGRPDDPIDPELAILVVPSGPPTEAPHWHRRIVGRYELLRLATGVAVGLHRRTSATEPGGALDVSELLEILKERFSIDVGASLGAESDEDALFLLYQMACRFAYAPGDPGANLHMLVLKPTGPAARLPWFAA